jgi:exopolyphosphatase/guanosine-5'-triphosphate,3'-diphosphate pyrophosphatase
MLRVATVDVGSNSVKLRAVELRTDESRADGGDAGDTGAERELGDWLAVTRLGEGSRETGRLRDDAIDRTVTALARLVARVREQGVTELAAVGTMALRAAANADDFVRRVEEACGLRVEILPASEEARLAYLGAVTGQGMPGGRVGVCDVGGGSTELVQGRSPGGGTEPLRDLSLPLGSRTLTEEFLRSDPVTAEELDSLRSALAERIRVPDWEAEELVGVGGAVTTLAAVHSGCTTYNPERIRGVVLTRAEIERQVELYRGLTVAERMGIRGLLPVRADVILAGAAIVLALLEKLGHEALVVSERGLRHGLLVDRFARRAAAGGRIEQGG